MNYRHAYHAGGVADVFKHIVTIALLNRLKQKESPFLALDTHAGIGIYDLAGTEAGKTAEFQNGIAKLRGIEFTNPFLREYRALVEGCNDPGSLRFYPGSPLLIAKLLRTQDRGIACELHSEDFLALRQTLKLQTNVAAHHRNGYEAMGAFLPPLEKRGLVLIDPPFENTTELSDVATAIRKSYKRFSNETYALWYPIKERPALWRFQEEMIAANIKKLLIIEFLTNDESDSRRLNGSGMFIINPPYQLEDDLKPALAELRVPLAPYGKVLFKPIEA